MLLDLRLNNGVLIFRMVGVCMKIYCVGQVRSYFMWCVFYGLVQSGLVQSCAFFERRPEDILSLPLLKNSPNDCYFVDDFMPIPKNLVTGKNGATHTRTYMYGSANYKDVYRKNIVLSFYSHDLKCWSLFEELYLVE
jgi:hypothetical protein